MAADPEVAAEAAAAAEVEAEATLCSALVSRRKRSASPARPSPITKSLNWKSGSSTKSTSHPPIETRYFYPPEQRIERR